jgi:hypothetical protein
MEIKAEHANAPRLHAPCDICKTKNWALGRWRNKGGHECHPYFCRTCLRRLDLYEKKIVAIVIGFIEIPVADQKACVRCGETGAEIHHWAPKEYFSDPDSWPIDPLCQKCHREWHDTIRGRRSKIDRLDDLFGKMK